jgi:hypothetical protein
VKFLIWGYRSRPEEPEATEDVPPGRCAGMSFGQSLTPGSKPDGEEARRTHQSVQEAN